jgi:hypothetical protein
VVDIKKLIDQLVEEEDPDIKKAADTIEKEPSKKDPEPKEKESEPEEYYTVTEFVGLRRIKNQTDDSTFPSKTDAVSAAEKVFDSREESGISSINDYYVIVTTTDENGSLKESSEDVYLISKTLQTDDTSEIYDFLKNYYENVTEPSENKEDEEDFDDKDTDYDEDSESDTEDDDIEGTLKDIKDEDYKTKTVIDTQEPEDDWDSLPED